MLPTLLAAVGVPDVKEQLLKGMKVGKKTFKVHLDGYNITHRLMGKGRNPRDEFFYWNDDGSLVGLRYGNWKVVFQEQRSHGFDVWQDPFTPLRLPKIINLRSDPFERAEHEGARLFPMENRPHVPARAGTGVHRELHRHLQRLPAEPEGGKLLTRSGPGAAHSGEHQREVTGDTPIGNAGTRRPAARIGCRPVTWRRRWSRTSTNGIRIRGRPMISTTIDGAGRSRTDGARTSICSGRTSRTQGSARSSSPAAEHRRRQSTPRDRPRPGGRDRLQCDECPAHGKFRRKYSLSNLEVHQLPIDRVCDLEMTFDEIVCTGVLHHLANPSRRSGHFVTCSSRTGPCISWCTRRTGGPASTCCRSSAGASASRPPTSDPRSRRRARRVAGQTSIGTPPTRGPGLQARGGAGRRPVAPAGSRVFSAAAPGLHQQCRAHVQPLGQAGPLQPSLRGDGAASAGVENRGPRTGRAVCRSRIVSRHDDEPQRHCPPRRSIWSLASDQFFRRCVA